MPRNALIVADAAGPDASALAVLKRFGFGIPATAPSVDAALDRIRDGHYDLVILPLQEITPLQLATIEREVRQQRFTFVIGTAPKPDPDLILRAMRAGIHEFVVHPPDSAELAAAVDRLMRRVPAEQQRGQVIAVYSSKGGVGNTSIAVNLAYGFAHNHPEKRVAIADLVVAGGDVRVFLNLNPQYHLGHLAEKLDRVDAELLTSLLTPTNSGVWVLPGPDNPELEDDLDANTIGTVIERLRTHFAFTVFDCEHHMSERTLAALDAADQVVIVTQLNVPALRSTQRTLALCRRLGYPGDKLHVVVNRYQPGDVLSIKDAETVLTGEVYFSLPNDYQLSSEALTRGVAAAEVNADAELSKAFTRLATKLGGTAAGEVPTPAAASTGSRLGRLFGLVRRA